MWLDTRFLATADSGAHDDYKKRLVAARSTETVLIPRCSTRAGRTRRIALYAGQSVGLIRDLPLVASVIAELARAFVYIQVFGNISQLDPAFLPEISLYC